MVLPDGRPLFGSDAVVPDPTAADGRVVFWLRGERSGGFQYWERVSSVPGAKVEGARGVRCLAMTDTPARQHVGALLPRLVARLWRPRGDQDYVLPEGGRVERCGPKRTDFTLAWAERDDAPLDEAAVRLRWPDSRDVRHVGRNLYLIAGVAPGPPREGAAAPPDIPPAEGPRAAAERALAAARAARARDRVLTALTDLGLTYLTEGAVPAARAVLEEALAGAREQGDQAHEADALNSLALAALIQNQPESAQAYLAPVLEYARRAADRYAEKLALERLGLACRGLGDHARALACFEQGAALARGVGDVQHEASLSWQAAIEHADLGRRGLAIARAQQAVALLRRLGKPQADWYARHLARYRSGTRPDSLARGGGPQTIAPDAYLGGSIDAAPAARANVGKPAVGPGVLRMAVTATQAMAKFVGSGFKTASGEAYKTRLAACAACAHHTGLRCRVCGCVTAAKARLAHEDCPIGKWPPEPGSRLGGDSPSESAPPGAGH